ncbi:hypothetical protein RQP46_008880 [Phenoliferia psychrophenolica]
MAARRQVGLGLMLNDDDTDGSGATPAGRGRAPAPAQSAAQGSATTTSSSAGDGPAAVRARELIANLGWDSDDFATEVVGTAGTIAHGPAGAGAGAGGGGPPHATQPVSLRRLSTTGGSPNPLLVYTGSQSESPSSMSPSHPPLPAPSPVPSQSGLSQRTYPVAPSSLSTPLFSTPALYPTSRTPSPNGLAGSSSPRAPAYLSSFAMDRSSSSGSMSRDIHGRQQSLTSACPPVTASPAGSTAGFFPPSVLGSPAQRGWKAYDWGSSKERDTLNSSASSSSSATSSSDGGPDRKGHRPSATPLPLPSPSALLSLPTTLLSYILAPLASSSSPPYHHAPALTGSTTPTQKTTGPAKRYPFPIRLLTISYLIFSVLFFALKLGHWTGGLGPGQLMTTAGDGKGRIAPRGDAQVARLDSHRGLGGLERSKVEGWAQKVAGGVRWGKALGYGGQGGDEEQTDPVEGQWTTVKRIGEQAFAAQHPETNPLTSLSHTYRFAKMHDKIHWDLPDEIEPYIFRATTTPTPEDVTACLYTNEAWLSTLPAFVRAWGGPVSLVFETPHSRTSPSRAALLHTLAALRSADPLVRLHVSFHLVGAPPSLSPRSLNKTRERLVLRPIAQNFHVNLARFFATTDLVFLVPDARVSPSVGLRTRLGTEAVRTLILDRGDAVVVPTFGFVRDRADGALSTLPTLAELRSSLGLAQGGAWDGIGEDEFSAVAAAHVEALSSSLPIARSQWPSKKAVLVNLVSTRVGTVDAPSAATVALFDKGWDLNHGPTNWYLWRKSATDPRLLEPPDLGGGVGLGVAGGVGGGRDVFRVADYDLHYAPNVVVSRKGQPWCTERFETMHAACVYQMYLAGAEMWVLPDEWAWTVEGTEKVVEQAKEDPAQKLKNSISSRLYGKFHQEACMHYGREFLSVQMWDSDKAQHLRQVCARTLGTWGMGAAS